jgi:hypothetical protein
MGNRFFLSYVSSSTPPTLFINSSVARMHAGREDYNKVLNGYNIYNETHTLKMPLMGFLYLIHGLSRWWAIWIRF